MTFVRKLEIRHFRGIASLDWCPGDGINCLIGPGDSCKTTILDAIDLCLGARRNLTLNDADFHGLDVKTPIEISVTVGGLNDSLKTSSPTAFICVVSTQRPAPFTTSRIPAWRRSSHCASPSRQILSQRGLSFLTALSNKASHAG